MNLREPRIRVYFVGIFFSEDNRQILGARQFSDASESSTRIPHTPPCFSSPSLFPLVTPISPSRLFTPPFISLPTRRLLGTRLNLCRPDREQRMFNSCRAHACEPGSSLFFHHLVLRVLISRHCMMKQSPCVLPSHPSPLCGLSATTHAVVFDKPFPFSIANLKLLLTPTRPIVLCTFSTKFLPSHHSLRDRAGESFRWLNFRSNCQTMLRQFRERTDTGMFFDVRIFRELVFDRVTDVSRKPLRVKLQTIEYMYI